MRRYSKLSRLFFLAACCASPFFGTACSSLEKTTERHVTHFIDAGDPLNDGAKISDDRPVVIVVYENGKAVGSETRPLAGMMVLTPNRYRALLIAEAVLSALLNRHTGDDAASTALRAEVDELFEKAQTQVAR